MKFAPHHMNHRSYIFNDLPVTVAPACQRLGYDYARLVAAKDRLYDHLHALQPKQIRLHAAGGRRLIAPAGGRSGFSGLAAIPGGEPDRLLSHRAH